MDTAGMTTGAPRRPGPGSGPTTSVPRTGEVVSAPGPHPAPAAATGTDRAHHLRCALFALVFAPIALVVMGMAVTDLQAAAAVGQPLSSSEGMVGALVAALLLVLISVNSEDSPAGAVVTAAVSVLVGAMQMLGAFHFLSFRASDVSGADMVVALSWGLYPVSVAAICAGSAAAVLLRRRSGDARRPTPRRLFKSHTRERTAVASSSMLLTGAAVLCLLVAAPRDTTEVAARGLPGILDLYTPHVLPGLLAALLLGIVALGARWSVMGTQVPAWLLMVLPGFFGFPVWATLTGIVITPGPSRTTAFGLTAPVVSALGLVLVATSLGVHFSRRAASAPVGDPDGTEEPSPGM
ncbi:hypothetical protein [Actinomyces polynesiensis]|uniref:hypothetical protein n=1 Tax=Actinomyces polynesiensis TaxID=1325934 RepID=UPI0006946C9C|nr:hypothetical protein [Actinomyces polynesiensis]